MSGNNPEWITCINERERRKKCLAYEVEEHPLKVLTVTERLPRRILGSQTSTGRTTPVSTPTTIFDISAALEGIDPLTKFAIEELDPLTQIANENAMKSSTSSISSKKQHSKKYEMEPWESRKASILNQFTTSEKISIVTSFLSDDEHGTWKKDIVIVKAQSSSIDKVQHRLEQLDYFEEGSQKKFDLSQVEYVRRIGQLNKELVSAWNSEQRVKALKIAIQCAKMLADTDVLYFYPSKFVLITDILDVFGKLVYERLRTKSNYIKPGSKTPTELPEDFTPDIVPELAKETCRNWFYKIASIRELVPRIYVEMAILKSYSFLTSSEYSAALLRLTSMIRGIGNPLVSVYARCYLCRVGISVTTTTKDSQYLVENFYDFLNLYDHIFSRSIKQELITQKMEVSSYLTLYTPALEFILQAVTCTAPEQVLAQILDRCQRQGNSPLLLNTIMAVFKPSYISSKCLQFLDMINGCKDEGFPLHILLRTLGLCVSVCPPLIETRRHILSAVWQRISIHENPEHYVSCCEPWVQYAAQYFMGDVNLIIGDIIRHMSENRAHENFYPQLKSIVEKIVQHTQDIEGLLAMDNFLPLIDLFQQETTRVEICKTILSACVGEQPISDPVIINTLMFLCSVLHDSVNALTIEDEYRQISDIVCGIVRKINYGRDFERQLSFYVEARGAFSNLYPVLGQLVQCVNLLAVKTRSIVNGHHTRKTGAFVRACAAYCFITIPSIAAIRTRLDLYLLSGQVALFNNCLGQADAFFKTALTIISELLNSEESPRSNEAYLIAYIRKMLSTLLVVPDSPDKGVLSLTRILLNVIQSYTWENQCNLTELYLNVLDMLATMAQDRYPYYVDKVFIITRSFLRQSLVPMVSIEKFTTLSLYFSMLTIGTKETKRYMRSLKLEKIECNDSLYGSDPKFIAEINKICGIILTEILNKLKDLGPSSQQSQLAIKLAIVIINRAELTVSNPMPSLAVNLWQLALKHKQADVKFANRTKEYYGRLDVGEKSLLKQIVSKLNLS